MKFLADENFPMPSVHLLREAGHDVEHVGMVARSAIDDGKKRQILLDSMTNEQFIT